jgi:hypothetical protein
MYVFYCDDTDFGHKDKLRLLGGLLISEDRFAALQERFHQVKVGNGLDAADPIKWSPGQNDSRYEAQRKIANINELRRDVLITIKNSDASLLVSVIHENEVSGVSIDFCIRQAVDQLAKRVQYEMQAKRSIARIVMDYPGHKHEAGLCEHYRTIWCNCASSGVKLSKLNNELSYSHCFGSDGLQMADMVVGATGHVLKKSNYIYFDLIKPAFRSYKGKIKGAGLIVFPSNSTIADHIAS